MQTSTPALATPPTMIAECVTQQPSLVHYLDSTMSSQIMAVRNSPVVLLPTAAGSLPITVAHQPYILVNPIDLALQQTLPPAATANLAIPTVPTVVTNGSTSASVTVDGRTSTEAPGMTRNSSVPEGGGYILLPTTAASGNTGMIHTPIVRLAGSTIGPHLTGM